jgi:hypothetical protein
MWFNRNYTESDGMSRPTIVCLLQIHLGSSVPQSPHICRNQNKDW